MGTEKRARQKAGRQARIEAAHQAQHRQETRSRALTIGLAVVVVLVVIGAVVFLTRDTGSEVATEDNPPTTSEDGAAIVERNGDPTETLAPGSAPAEVPPPGPGASITGETPCPAADGSSERTTSFEQAPPMCIDPAKTYTATFETNLGSFTAVLDTTTTPETANNFVVLSRYHYYDDTSIFRIAPSIAVFQGGSPTTNSASDPGPGYTIPDEGGEFTDLGGGQLEGPFTYQAGDLVMARSAGPDSSGAQYFVATGPEVSGLDSQGTYLKFGAVTQGLDVVEKIASLYVPYPPDSPYAQLGGGPSEPVIVEKLTITES